MNHDVNGNRKFFWKEVSIASGGKNLYNIDAQEQVAVHICGIDGFGEATTLEEGR